MTLRINIELEGRRRFSRNLHETPAFINANLNRALRRIGSVVVPVLKGATPRRTGKLARSTRFQIKGHGEDQALEVRQGAKTEQGEFYGHFVREGTAAHIIEPVRASALAFVVGGKLVFAKRVQHPGTAANPYHIRAVAQVRSRIDTILEDLGARIVRHVGRGL